MIDFKNRIYTGSAGRKSVFDCHIGDDATAVIIFAHGFKGYKDWGAWNLMEESFINAGFGFVKFNMTHNGGTVENPIDFPDLEAFGNNRYSYEVNDLDTVIGEVEKLNMKQLPIYLLGHSRGGGIVLLQSSGDQRIKKVATLASISDISSRFPNNEEIEQWENEGVRYIKNGRTNQNMPLYYSLYLDYAVHHIDLDIEIACRSLDVPILVIHGDDDEAVDLQESKDIAEWTQTSVEVITGAGHTFGASHPWEKQELPTHLKEATEKLIEFFSK